MKIGVFKSLPLKTVERVLALWKNVVTFHHENYAFSVISVEGLFLNRASF